MQTYKKLTCQHVLSRLLTKEKAIIGHNAKTARYKVTFPLVRTIAFTGLSIITMYCAAVNATSITAEMSPEVATEYKKQLALQDWPAMHTKLALMDNPYSKFHKVIRKKLKEEAPAGQRRRLMTEEESMLTAKKTRFDYCQASVSFFVDFSERAQTLSTVEQNPLSEDALMKGNGVEYPFTKEQTNSANFRPTQIALTLGWKYKGKGKQYAEAFLASCLAIPISLYYKEDK
ncbi:hypothetical protein [Colwellia sp. 12G3]|uniref:hypothetical protein n=1 Tax=Colwellia sp. 12G3 TaxID=2058299 RepID=UPI000C328333|nr:hypothetical protein [Colwellia sp. 12G3]PKI13527.1 hypothetical protein CXF71_17660 [Colwellia sp. 12G3]